MLWVILWIIIQFPLEQISFVPYNVAKHWSNDFALLSLQSSNNTIKYVQIFKTENNQDANGQFDNTEVLWTKFAAAEWSIKHADGHFEGQINQITLGICYQHIFFWWLIILVFVRNVDYWDLNCQEKFNFVL